MSLNESVIEEATLEWFEGLDYACTNGLLIAPGEPSAEREAFGEVVLVGRLRKAIRRPNPSVPEDTATKSSPRRLAFPHSVESRLSQNAAGRGAS
jgi:type I restriction enzyme R subunit